MCVSLSVLNPMLVQAEAVRFEPGGCYAKVTSSSLLPCAGHSTCDCSQALPAQVRNCTGILTEVTCSYFAWMDNVRNDDVRNVNHMQVSKDNFSKELGKFMEDKICEQEQLLDRTVF